MAQGRILLALALLAPASLSPSHAADAVTAGPVVQDDRPAGDKKFSIHSAWITSCNYGVYTTAELPDAPTHVQALQQDLAALPNNPWAGHTIVVTHYAVYVNAKHSLRVGTAVGVTAGVVGAVARGVAQNEAAKQASINGPAVDATPDETLPENQHGCHADQMDGGWYASSETHNNFPPLVTEITATVDDRPIKVRSIYSVQESFFPPKLKTDASRKELAEAVRRANEVFAQKIALPSTAAVSPPLTEAVASPTKIVVATDKTTTSSAGAPSTSTEEAATSNTPPSMAIKPPAQAVSAAPMAQAPPMSAQATNAQWLSNANAVASQLGCGSATASGGSTFVAQCSGYKLAIDCDGGNCHPTHTVADN